MGLYDDIEVDGRSGQVKLFLNCMYTYHEGDVADLVGGPDRYSIAMREGGFVHVIDRRICAWRDTPLPDAPIYDKWGDNYEVGVTTGIMGDTDAYVFGGDA